MEVKIEFLLSSKLRHWVNFSQASSGGTEVEFLTNECEISGLRQDDKQ